MVRFLQNLIDCFCVSCYAAWTTDKCQPPLLSLTAVENKIAALWLVLGFLLGSLVTYCFAKRRFLRGDTGGQYRPVNENEVRSLIREYVDTAGVKSEEQDGGDNNSRGLYNATP